MKVKIKKHHNDAIIPEYKTKGASGFDLHAVEDVLFFVNDTKLVSTGLSFQVPEGYELQVRPRSGMSLKTPMRVSNSPGTIDSDFSGIVCVIMTHIPCGQGTISYSIKKGDRIAQGVILPIIKAEFEEVDELDKTERGACGFGSTGK